MAQPIARSGNFIVISVRKNTLDSLREKHQEPVSMPEAMMNLDKIKGVFPNSNK